jgi:hypothetical protein
MNSSDGALICEISIFVLINISCTINGNIAVLTTLILFDNGKGGKT